MIISNYPCYKSLESLIYVKIFCEKLEWNLLLWVLRELFVQDCERTIDEVVYVYVCIGRDKDLFNDVLYTA